MATGDNPFGDVAKMFEQFKMPGVDMGAILEASRKEMEAMVEANKAAYESIQAMARKQAEMMTQAMQSMQEAAQAAISGADPSRQKEIARKAVERTLADMRELAEMGRQSQADAMAHLTQRASEQMEAIKKLMQLR